MAKIGRTVGWLADKARNGAPPRAEKIGDPLSLEVAFPSARADPSGCLILDRLVAFPSFRLPGEATTRALLGELRLLFGVGERYDRRLRAEGYASIADLREHPRWADAANALLADWGSPPDAGAVYRSLDRWLPSTDPLQLLSLGLLPIEGLRFFDLETLGLGGSPVFLAAIGRFVNGGFLIRQTLIPSLGAEIALLERTAAELRDASALLSYNGKSFDWTILRERLAYYGLPLPEPPIHVDLLHHARRAFGSEVPDCHLGTIEERVLGVERSDDLPSAEVPIHYTAYLETGDAAHLVPIVNHSRQDLASLVVLLERLLRTADDA